MSEILFLTVFVCVLNMDDDKKNLLIEQVQLYPCLWNIKLPEYKDAEKKANAWIAVADALDTTGKNSSGIFQRFLQFNSIYS